MESECSLCPEHDSEGAKPDGGGCVCHFVVAIEGGESLLYKRL